VFILVSADIQILQACVFLSTPTSSILHSNVIDCKVKGKVVWGSGYIDPHFLDLGTSW
jgi:hypothetical protein